MKDKIILILILILIGLVFLDLYFNLTTKPIEKKIIIHETEKAVPFFQRMDINEIVINAVKSNDIDEILAIYDGICNPELVYMIINSAIMNDIPLSLLLAIIDVESKFDPKAYNKNTNKTIDRGLMSLNSKTFSNFAKEQLYDPKINLKLGCEHLVGLKKRYGKWGLAIIHYNGLYSKGAGVYLVNVIEKERYYEKLFNERLK